MLRLYAWSVRMEGLWRTRAAVADDRAMYTRRVRLARGRMQPLQDAGKLAARCHPPAAGYADLELEAALKCRSCRKSRHAPPCT